MGVTSSGMSGPSGVPSFGSGFRVFSGALLYIFPTAVHHTVWLDSWMDPSVGVDGDCRTSKSSPNHPFGTGHGADMVC